MKRALVILAVLGLLLLGGWFIHRNTTWRVEKIHTGFKPEAQRNPLLAAQFLLEGRGRQPVARIGLPGADAGLKAADTVIVVDRARGCTPQEAERLLAFARAGGQVVLELDATQTLAGDPERSLPADRPRAFALRDHLLERLGAAVVPTPWKPLEAPEDDSGEDEAAEAERERRNRAAWEPALRLDDGEPFTVRVDPRHRLADAGREGSPGGPARTLADDRGAVGLEYPVGAGRIRIFTDLDAWKNRRLVKLDHAEFLLWTLQDRPREGRVWLVRGERAASLGDWLKDHAWAALAALAGLVALVVWRGFARLGPVLPAPEAARRSLLEHVDASGRLLWSEGQGGRMLRAARAALMKRIERVHPAWAKLPLPLLSSRLADFADLAEPEVRRALFDDHPADATAFRNALRTLECLRRSL